MSGRVTPPYTPAPLTIAAGEAVSRLIRVVSSQGAAQAGMAAVKLIAAKTRRIAR